MVKKTAKTTSFFVALVLTATTFFAYHNNVELRAMPFPSDLPVAEEVKYDRTTTTQVSDAWGFLAAYKITQITRIVLLNDIELPPDVARLLREQRRVQSLQIDGQGHTMKSISNAAQSDSTTFYLDRPRTAKATFHLKNMNIWSRGTNFIDANGVGRSDGWDIILENTTFGMNGAQQDEVRRVVRGDLADLYLRGDVEMMSHGENAIVSSVTVAPRASVYGVVTYFDNATWWIKNARAKGTINIGQGASVGLAGNKMGYPVIYEHWRGINVHKDAILKAYKPGGSVYAFKVTPGVEDKYINVAEGAQFSGVSENGGGATLDIPSGRLRARIHAGRNSAFTLIGNPSSTNTAVLSVAARGSTVTFDSASAVDIRNNCTGGRAINIGSDSLLDITNANVRTWNKGRNRDLDGAASHTWHRVSLKADGTGRARRTDNESIYATWDTNDYARIICWHVSPPINLP